jgi:hypothetical protein
MPRVQKIPRSPAQIEASRKNGAKSHGALSPETRKICSRNSFKTGLYAESRLISGESEEEYNAQYEIWCRRLGVTPDGPEALLAESSFDNFWKYERGVRILDEQRQQAIAEIRQSAVPDLDIERIEAELIAEKIHDQPRETLISLFKVPGGCELLATRWEALLKATRDDDCFFPSMTARMTAMLGKKPDEVLENDLSYEINRIYLSMMRPAELGLTIDNVMGIYADTMPSHSKGYRGEELRCRINQVLTSELTTSGAEAAQLQRALIGKEIAKLRDRAARLRREREARVERAVSEAELPGTVEAVRKDRHVEMMYRRAERGIALARKLRKERLAEGDEPDDRGAEPVAVKRRPVPARTTTPQPPEPPAAPAPPVSGARGPGPTGGMLPLLLFLLLPVLRSPGLAPHADRGALLDMTPHALGAWGRSPHGQTPEALPPQAPPPGASPAPGRLIPSHTGRKASRLDRSRHRVRRASAGARGRGPQGQTPDVPAQESAATGASPAPGRLVPSHAGQTVRPRNPDGHGVRPASHGPDSSLIPHPSSLRSCRNGPELGASRVASRSSSLAIAAAARIGLRPRDSPGRRGPPLAHA